MNILKGLILVLLLTNRFNLICQNYQRLDSVKNYVIFGNQIGFIDDKNLSLFNQNGIFYVNYDADLYELFYEKGIFSQFDSMNIVDIELVSLDSICEMHLFKPEFGFIESNDSMFACLFKGEFKYDTLTFTLYFYSDISIKETIKLKYRDFICNPRILYLKNKKYLLFQNNFMANKKSEDYYYLGVTGWYFIRI